MSYFSLQNSCGLDVQILSCRNLSYKSKKMTENPWQVESIQAFTIFQCPECLFEAEEEIQFENHATENHSLSFVLFGAIVALFDILRLFDVLLFSELIRDEELGIVLFVYGMMDILGLGSSS